MVSLRRGLPGMSTFGAGRRLLLIVRIRSLVRVGIAHRELVAAIIPRMKGISSRSSREDRRCIQVDSLARSSSICMYRS